ncbi:DUF2461 domain-containing protein [Oceanomicrobium pacificus]|uniref:TIGR02453 family protein n=1 Tax=Oceanomicrobium pacificus TaxID=2692916 RepID=A0A6B0TZ17_9RHOB|nr:DUF2461 domain-containing protein [Oceanomicrobium pacificus]MXU66512.1 TIGR02453 family protein [Oceanomicrobium pacificus]
MTETDDYPAAAQRFLSELAQNNDRDWFTARKSRFQRDVAAPSDALLDDLATRFGPEIGRTLSRKSFRMHRDLRFSKDKTPYVTHYRALLRDTSDPEPDPARPAFYFSLEPGGIQLGGGVLAFAKPALERYRHAIGNSDSPLLQLATALEASGWRLGEPDLKRVPAPYPADHPDARFLRHKGLHAFRPLSGAAPDGSGLFAACAACYQELVPFLRAIASLT